MRQSRSESSPTPRVVGARPLGVTKKVTAEILRDLRNQLSQNGRSVTIRSLRFIPSSRSTIENGSFRVGATNFVEVTSGKDTSPHPEALESVVTIGLAGRIQTFEGLMIPGLRHATS